MDRKRAEEIIASPVMIDVMCNGNMVYIDSINEHRETANVYPIDHPDMKHEVPIINLVEQ